MLAHVKALEFVEIETDVSWSTICFWFLVVLCLG